MADRGNKRGLSYDESAPPPEQKKERFPKGKKSKKTDDVAPAGDYKEELKGWMDPQLAAKERKKRRDRIREDEVFGVQVDVSSAEVQYEDNTNFEDDGVRIEPFNLKQEREEGYFDANGNFVEYAKQNEIKDAWLDSVEVDARFLGKIPEKKTTEEVFDDLSSDDIGKIKRSIANALEPGETIKQALRRLKGTSTDKRIKMPEVTKRVFDELTEHAMKLMENGEYNVYEETRETFEREAEGYERLACAKLDTSTHATTGSSDFRLREGNISDAMQHGDRESSIWDIDSGPSAANVSVLQVPSIDDGEKFDMFGEDDENADENLHSGPSSAVDSANQQVDNSTSRSLEESQALDSGEVACGDMESDYVYDQSSGYYYNSSLGYYYDPASGMYASASTGTWYTFDEQNGTYTEVLGVQQQEAEGS